VKQKRKPRVLNKAHDRLADRDPDAVYVGRPSRWGNPYKIGAHGTREEIVAKFREKLLSDAEEMAHVRASLRGRDLVCWCAPLPCHADVLLEVANS
jgi:hypothetical protein